MGIPRERQVFVGLGVVAVAGLMFDKVVLAPSGASASEPAALASATPAAAIASAAAGKLQSGLRDAIDRAFEAHAHERMPELLFGPDDAWLSAPAGPTAAQPPSALAEEPVASGVLPGLDVRPTLSLVMPTGRGGLAVIDGKRIAVGEIHPDGYRLIAVDDRSVTIGYAGATAVLRLPSPAGDR